MSPHWQWVTLSSSLVDQLNLKQIELAKPLPLHLAVQGSRSKVNCGVMTQFEYQEINTMKYFDIINLSNYDLILGTPFLYQHKVILTLNEPSV
jgi:hypothetical protein